LGQSEDSERLAIELVLGTGTLKT